MNLCVINSVVLLIKHVIFISAVSIFSVVFIHKTRSINCYKMTEVSLTDIFIILSVENLITLCVFLFV